MGCGISDLTGGSTPPTAASPPHQTYAYQTQPEQHQQQPQPIVYQSPPPQPPPPHSLPQPYQPPPSHPHEQPPPLNQPAAVQAGIQIDSSMQKVGSNNDDPSQLPDSTESPTHLTTALHGDHPLTLYSESHYSNRMYTCNACRQDGSGMVYSCRPCQFDLHPNCVKLSQITPNAVNASPSTPLLTLPQHPHPLTPYPRRYADGRFNCDLCGMGSSGSAFSCDACQWDCCTACFQRNGGLNNNHPTQMVVNNETSNTTTTTRDVQTVFKPASVTVHTPALSSPPPAQQAGDTRESTNFIPTWPSADVAFGYPSRPYAWSVGSESRPLIARSTGGSTQLVEGLTFDAMSQHFPYEVYGTPQQFFQQFHRIIFLDLRKFERWTVGRLIDAHMNAVVWSAIFEASKVNTEDGWKDLAERGILCCCLEEIPLKDSIFITHRWSINGGICSMSPSFLQAYTLYTCQIKGSQPCWIWLDLLSVPQLVPGSSSSMNSYNLQHSTREIELRLESNRAYMSFIGLKFGKIASRCDYFFHHQPLTTIVDRLSGTPLRSGGIFRYDSQRRYFEGWGMEPNFLQFEDHSSALKAGMTCLESIRLYTSATRLEWTHPFYSDLSYTHRIWCLAEYLIRIFECGRKNFIDIGNFVHELWEQHGPEDLKQRTGGFVKKNTGGSYNPLLKDMKLGTQKELKDEYVLEAIQQCYGIYRSNKKLLASQHAKLLTSIFTLEGMFTIVASASATVVRDVPIVMTTLFRKLCHLMFDVPHEEEDEEDTIPRPIQRMLDWCMTNGACAKRVTPNDGIEWMKMCREFYQLFDTHDNLLKDYLTFIGPSIRMGTNSLFLLDRILATLLLNGHGLSYDTDSANELASPSSLTPLPTLPNGVPSGYEYAPTACWYLETQLQLDVREYFTDAEHGTNLPYMSDFGTNLIAGEQARLYKKQGWDHPKPDFPGYPQSEWLYAREEASQGESGIYDPLSCFQPLSLAHCPYRPCYGISHRQSDVLSGDNFRASDVSHPPSRFITEHVYLQLDGRCVGKTIQETRQWTRTMKQKSNPAATKEPGTRRITSETHTHTHAIVAHYLSDLTV